MAFGAIINISSAHNIDRYSVYAQTILKNFKVESIENETKKSIEKGKESISEEKDENVWATENINYRKGPDEKYDIEGTLNKYSKIHRTGITFNNWSRVEINDKEYYIYSKYLTNEEPVLTEVDSGTKGEYQKYALSQFPNYGWDESELVPLIKLWNRESGWKPTAHNRYSGAHGIPQALPAGKMASEGSDYYTNGETQIRWGLKYIKGRYGSPSNAWAHSEQYNWY